MIGHSHCPQLHRDLAHRVPTSAPGLGSPSAHICTGTGLPLLPTSAPGHSTSVLGQVLTVWTRALVVFRSNPISANAPQTPEKLVCVWGGGGGGNAKRARPVWAQLCCAAPVALQLAARHRSGVICHTRHGRSMNVACCMLHVVHTVCLVLHVACCHLGRTL